LASAPATPLWTAIYVIFHGGLALRHLLSAGQVGGHDQILLK
jgi:hypothetical protein